MAKEQETFLPRLARSFKSIDYETQVATRDFATACEAILPIFDHLGELELLRTTSTVTLIL